MIVLKNEKNFYDKIADWDFSRIKYVEESLTNWELDKKIKENSNADSIILDLGTSGWEMVLQDFPKVKK